MTQREYRSATDPFLLDELLNGVDEWRSVQDIVRLTFKALSDEIKAHGRSIVKIEQFLENTRNFSRSTSHSDELLTLVNSKLSRNDLNYYLSDKVTFQDLKEALDTKADLRDVQYELRHFHQSIEEFHAEAAKRISTAGSYRDLQKFSAALDEKADAVEVASALKDKANKQSVANAMNRKANKADVESMVSLKLDASEFQAASARTSAELANVKELCKDLADKLVAVDRSLHAVAPPSLTQSQVEALVLTSKSELEGTLQSLKEDVQFAVQKPAETEVKLIALLNKKADSDILPKLIDSVRAECKALLRECHHESELLRLLRACQERISQSEEEVKDLRSLVHSALDEAECSRPSTSNDELRQYLHKLSYLQLDVEDLRTKKADRLELRRDPLEPSWKDALKIQYNELTQYIQEVHTKLQETVYQNEREVLQIVEKKLTNNYQPDLGRSDYLSKRLDELARDLQAFPAEFTALLEQKANAEYVKDLFCQLTDAIETRANEQKTFMDDQLMINEVVCRENCVGRWIWKSGQIKKGYAVPWEVESVNTCPENFMWEKDSTNLLIVAPGLYQVIYGVFSRTKPSIQLLVNGETTIIGGCPATKTWGAHASGNVCGLTFSDFVALPPRARLCLTYNNDSVGEGFLGIKKL